MGIDYSDILNQLLPKSTLNLDDIGTIIAAQTILSNSAMRAGTTVPSLANTVSYTKQTPQTAQTVFTNTVSGSYGARLATISLSVDAVFQSNYNWLIQIASITGPDPGFQQFDPTVNVFDSVPTGKFFLLKPGATITIKAYNRNSSNTNNGIMSVYVVYDQLSQIEAAVIKRYGTILSRIAGLPVMQQATVPPVTVTQMPAAASNSTGIQGAIE